jgi:hypothetical protein
VGESTALPSADPDRAHHDKHLSRLIGANLRRQRSQNNLSLDSPESPTRSDVPSRVTTSSPEHD